MFAFSVKANEIQARARGAGLSSPRDRRAVLRAVTQGRTGWGELSGADPSWASFQGESEGVREAIPSPFRASV